MKPGRDGPDAREYRGTLGRFATGVTLVTAAAGDERRAMTANSFTSVSLNSPIVLVAVGRGLGTNGLVRRSGAFAVNVLSVEQRGLAERFDGPKRQDGSCEDVTTRPGRTGSPLVEGCLAWLDCRVGDLVEQGDHTVFFGRAEEFGAGVAGEPLLFYGGSYSCLRLGLVGDEGAAPGREARSRPPSSTKSRREIGYREHCQGTERFFDGRR